MYTKSGELMSSKRKLLCCVAIAVLAIGAIGAYLFIGGANPNNGNTDDKTTDICNDDEINDILDDYGIDPDSELAKTISSEVKGLTQTYNDKKGVIYNFIENYVSESNVDASKVVNGPLWKGYNKSSDESYVIYWLDIYASIEHQKFNEKNNGNSDLWTKDFPQWSEILRNNGIPLNAQTFDTIIKWVTVDLEEYPEANEMNGHVKTPSLRHTPEGWDRELLEQFDGVHRDKYVFNTLYDYENQQETLENNIETFVKACPSDIKEKLSEKIDEAKQLITDYNDDVTEAIQGGINKSKV